MDPAAPAARRTKIVRLIPVLDFGGVEAMFVLQAGKIDRSRFDFRVCTFWQSGAAAERIKAAGCPVTSLEIDPSVRNPRATAALIRHLRRERPDILHASIGEANFHAALAAKAAPAGATIIEEQGIPDRKLLSRLVHAGLYRLVDGIVAVSQASRDYMVKREWAPRDRLHLLPNSIADAFLDTPPPERTPGKPFRFVTIGRLSAVKNQARLIRAFALASSRNLDLDLTIVGDGPLMGELCALVEGLGLAGKVHFPGFSSDIIDLLDSSDCFLLPSMSEGFGIAAVEALARGLPVIASSVGALPEIVGPLGQEWLVAPTDVASWADRMQRMVELNPARRAENGRIGREIAESFGSDRHVERLEALYDSFRDASVQAR